MPRLVRKLPSYRLHKVSGHAVVTIAGRDHYLGPHGSPESLDAYKRLIAEWTTTGPAAAAASNAATKAGAEFRICELLAAYFKHADRYYVKDGQPTGEAANIKFATRLLQTLYGMLPVAEFGPSRTAPAPSTAGCAPCRIGPKRNGPSRGG